MTNKEILQADLLDILFEHRNKAYGAYYLRKNYSKRMGRAIGITMSVALLLFIGMNALAKKSLRTNPDRPNNDSVVIHAITTDDPVPTKPPDQFKPPEPAAQRQFTAHIEIVPDRIPTDVPEVEDLTNKLIGTINLDGRLLNDPNELIRESPIITKGLGDGEKKDDSGFIPIEKQPRYPGGMEAFSNFLSRYLQSPDNLEPGEKKVVLVRFKVDVDGTISDIAVVQSAGNIFDREVIRVLKKMPKWEPAEQNGHKVATFFTQPVTFVGLEG
jgi:periplasmic protein TonB